MAKSHSDEIVLSYYDCLLRASDVALLQGTHWLNDVIIGFYFEYLDQRYNGTGEKEFYFISPELTQLLKMTDPSQYSIFLDPVNVSNSKCIIFPLNNCDKKDAAGGSHWSLLVYSKQEKTCYHFDSSKGFNSSIASKFAKNIMSCILNENNLNGKFVEADCPQQDNGYDCGIYVLCLTDVIVQYVLKTGRVGGCDCSEVKRLSQLKRTQLLNLINELKRKLITCT
ncbi:sentrin-specific protease 8-like [Osmia bicornis bicornis]|uniref:sentrin-specific protease 8-like n=1 Tax=Osmia bicornis bicornis TaxID=1437191 RepID=UPI0010FA3E1C|nr:sentrin-specific protease 8-like [Osmia bicornis bicornis]XP_029034139.1 sentrin-specific protease 8-like [Osmia bicornis bicornis]